MAATVYIETTVPSAYVTTRSDVGSLYRREASREWWSQQLQYYEARTSDGVLTELRRGGWPGQAEAISLIEPLPRVVIDAEVRAVAAQYIAHRLVPDDLAGDAIPLAATCVHEFDFLLTWNIRHLANPNKLNHLTVINRRLGLLTPQIVTPDMLWMEEF